MSWLSWIKGLRRRKDYKVKLSSDEHKLIGKWVEAGDGRVVGDETCERVEVLVEKHLQELGVSPESGGWDTLFCDPADGRFWERVYLQSEMHGGGPPSLFNLPVEEAKRKYPHLF